MKHFAVIDVETSGGNPRSDRITEISIHLFDGEKVIDRYTTLINPETPIPYLITKITGITNDMVKDAPKFYEVAKRVVEITQDAIFVAHNVRFDYGFIQSEFRSLGYTFTRQQLCTVRLSQKLIPESPSHSLGNLCKHLGIVNKNAHRADADAAATVELLKHLFSLEQNLAALLKTQIADVKLPPNLAREVFEALPEDKGVYYMHDKDGDVIYVGKSNTIRDRIRSHFGEAHKKQSALRMFNQVSDLSFEITGNELIALLVEDEEIKRLQPKFNRRQRKKNFHFGIFVEPDAKNYLRLKIDRLDGKEKPESSYTTRKAAEVAIQKRIEKYNLCPTLCGFSTGQGPCFQHQIRICKGACMQVESPNEYNERVEAALQELNYGKKRFLVIGDGRSHDEKSVVWVEDGCYQGYAYLDNQILKQSFDAITALIPHKPQNPDILHILRNYIKTHYKEVREG